MHKCASRPRHAHVCISVCTRRTHMHILIPARKPLLSWYVALSQLSRPSPHSRTTAPTDGQVKMNISIFHGRTEVQKGTGTCLMPLGSCSWDLSLPRSHLSLVWPHSLCSGLLQLLCRPCGVQDRGLGFSECPIAVSLPSAGLPEAHSGEH